MTPKAPRGVSITSNMREAHSKKIHFSRGGTSFLFSWFYTKVRSRGPWNYKRQGRKYEDFGNFNYGATGTAAGISEEVLLRGAGWAQSQAGTSEPEFGSWWSNAPYGDDPKDQRQIKAGIEYAKRHGY
ncbi:polymorphic toxin type 44 domain-containing protein [Pseudomonas sp. 148P]|uniref:Polymorphic toxin type 44 domain-containing protein n=1 Tax=Pseudomonas ulcerans TaxID=3115852 RepID=A0ABU7HTZ4_9PSED|nr:MULTISPECIES: polymorphic toxin type 44 domain-containing protein [unclassified Pseudomonas]MEE1925290.1 polymorphic toxin type 44 domain-containing protein [Pseudomonas sp. 147P]MEE1935016.1 polymorphic toxin type 44 domain-containing protein [Pseudomonas sp. 148P]